jgi:hypothetical protein
MQAGPRKAPNGARRIPRLNGNNNSIDFRLT